MESRSRTILNHIVQCLILGLASSFSTVSRQDCSYELGMSDGRIQSNQLMASSVMWNNIHYQPDNARLGSTKGQGAWCSAGLVDEYFQVDLLRNTVVTSMATQGRHGGTEYASSFEVQYKRDADRNWRTITQGITGTPMVFTGLPDPSNVSHHIFPHPMVARWVRVLPRGDDFNWLCVRLELYGCAWAQDSLVSYRLPGKFVDVSGLGQLADSAYDGVKVEGGEWYDGLGALADGLFGHTMFLSDGWVALAAEPQPSLKLEFENDRIIRALTFVVYQLTSSIPAFSSVELRSSTSSGINLASARVYDPPLKNQDRVGVVTVTLKTQHVFGSTLECVFQTNSPYLLISEVLVESERMLRPTTPAARVLRRTSRATTSRLVVMHSPITNAPQSSTTTPGSLHITSTVLVEELPSDQNNTGSGSVDDPVPSVAQSLGLQQESPDQQKRILSPLVMYSTAGVAALLLIAVVAATIFYRRRRTQLNHKRAEEGRASSRDRLLSLTNGVSGRLIPYQGVLGTVLYESPVLVSAYQAMDRELELSPDLYQRNSLLCEYRYGQIHSGEMKCPSLDAAVDGASTVATPVYVLSLTKKASFEMTQMFADEARLLSCIRHPDITRLLGAHMQRSPPTMVLEGCGGMHLDEWLRSYYGRFSEPPPMDMVRIASRVACALNYLSTMGLVHRDVSARNVLLSPGLETVKVTSVASALPRYRSCYFHIPGKQFPLPVRWLSPESAVEYVFSAQSDIWSFGILLCELCPRDPSMPYTGLIDSQVVAILHNIHMTGNMKVVESIVYPPKGTPPVFYELAGRCLVRDPRERISPSELYSLLVGALNVFQRPASASSSH